jgi:hypothetical protein
MSEWRWNIFSSDNDSVIAFMCSPEQRRILDEIIGYGKVCGAAPEILGQEIVGDVPHLSILRNTNNIILLRYLPEEFAEYQNITRVLVVAMEQFRKDTKIKSARF